MRTDSGNSTAGVTSRPALGRRLVDEVAGALARADAHRVSRQGGGAQDAGVVAELRRDDRRAEVQVLEELVPMLRDAAPDHEQVGREQHLEVGVVLLEALAPLLP